MSANVISGISGVSPAPLNLTAAEVQGPAKVQSAPEVAAAQTTANATQTILMVPTRPPLSNAVLAELMGQQAAVFGSPLAQVSSVM